MSLCPRTRIFAAASILTTALLAPNPSLAERTPDREIAARRTSAAAPLSPVSLVSHLWSLLNSLWQADRGAAPIPGRKPGPVPGQAGPDDGSVGGGDNGSSLDPNGHTHN